MANEKPNYRLVLEDIKTTTQRNFLNIKDVMNYTGKSRTWCTDHIPFVDGYITAAALAQYIA